MLLCPTPCSVLNCSLRSCLFSHALFFIRNSIITFPNQYSTSYLDKMFYNSLSDMHSLNEQMHNKQYLSFHRFLSDWWKLCSTCTLSRIKLQDFVVVVTSSVLSVRILATCFLTKSSSHKFFFSFGIIFVALPFKRIQYRSFTTITLEIRKFVEWYDH